MGIDMDEDLKNLLDVPPLKELYFIARVKNYEAYGSSPLNYSLSMSAGTIQDFKTKYQWALDTLKHEDIEIILLVGGDNTNRWIPILLDMGISLRAAGEKTRKYIEDCKSLRQLKVLGD